MKSILAVIAGLLLASFAVADEARPVYVEIIEGRNLADKVVEYTVKWKVPPVMRQGQAPLISLEHPSCTVSYGANTSGLLGRKLYQCTDRVAELIVNLHYPHSNPALTSLIVVKPQAGEPIQIFSDPDKKRIAISLLESASAVATQYTVAGIEHILAGTDHLLFVLCLIIIAGRLKRLLMTVSGFTLAHSVTLSLATLDIFRLPAELVELLIALSIVLLAGEIIKHNRAVDRTPLSFTWRYPVTVATVFGLLHGFGFAAVLQELGLPSAMKLYALLFFNLGVELGQLMFIAVVLAVVSIARHRFDLVTRRSVACTEVAVYGIGICSAYWLIERSLLLF